MNRAAWAYAWRFCRPERRRLAASLVVSTLRSAVLLPVPYLIKRVFDDVLPGGSWPTLALLAGATVGLTLLNLALDSLARLLTLRAAKDAIARLRVDMVEALYACPGTCDSGVERRELHSSLVQDTQRLDVMINGLVAVVVPAAVLSGVMSMVLVVLEPRLVLLTVAAVPIGWAVSRALGRIAAATARRHHAALDGYSRALLTVLQRLELTRTQAAEAVEIERYRARCDDLARDSRRNAWLRHGFAAVNHGLLALWTGAVLVAGGYLVIEHRLTLGALLSFYAIVVLIRTYLSPALSALPEIVEGYQALVRLSRRFAAVTASGSQGRAAVALPGEIRGERLHFGYGPEPILRGVDLRIMPHRFVLIVGANGAGKTTLIKLLLGLHEPGSGRLLAGGVPYAEIDLAELRRHIGVVPQDTQLVSGTVAENVAYGSPAVDMPRVVEAATLAMAHPFVAGLPLGYETTVGEDGAELSGGQRQLLAIARAVYRRPSLFILDEPGNHLGRATVARILVNLRGMPGRPAVLMVSHGHEAVDGADEVYELAEGRLQLLRAQPGEAAGRRPAPGLA